MDPSHRMRPLAALAALRRLLKDREDTSQVFVITSSLRGKSALRGARRLGSTQAGRAVLAEKRSLLPALCDRAALAALPAGSFGRAYHDFVVREHISAEGLVEASLVQKKYPAPTAEEQLFRERVRDMHDLWHVLTGYGRDPLGETCVVAFTYAQTRSLGLAVISLLGTVKITQALRGAPVRSAVLEAYRHGRAAAWLPGEDLEQLMREPLEAVRARLGIAPPERYKEIMAGLASGVITRIPSLQ
jgi:ubiquinone biosynthesis protein COQ4